MSGGVDSSLMAALLREQGAEVIGVFLQVWDYQRDQVTRHGSCCATEDAYDARRVCDKLGIPFYAMDMRQNFAESVIEPFIDDYARGRTPNPCERCNRFVKFGALLRAANELEVEWIATGHYVQRMDNSEGSHLLRAVDRDKDQSYFLATTRKEAIARLLFPLGAMRKETVREAAAARGLHTADKQESQDICFIPDGDRIAFLQRHGNGTGLQPGEIVSKDGTVLGRHHGIAHFTLGQRRGLGLSGGPWRVVALDGEQARVHVAPAKDVRLRRLRLTAWNRICPQSMPSRILAMVRYRATPQPCRWQRDGDSLVLDFESPCELTAPGQVVALYDGDELLGGGIIREVELDS